MTYTEPSIPTPITAGIRIVAKLCKKRGTVNENLDPSFALRTVCLKLSGVIFSLSFGQQGLL
jgi:hypothetical protein